MTSNIILIDNGHGAETPGKCSPDGRLREYAWTRQIARRVCDKLKAPGYDARLLVPELNDVSLRERVRRVNRICTGAGSNNVLLVSIHVNAAGTGQWHNASGWTAWVAPNASQRSRKLATLLNAEAVKLNLKGNRSREPFFTGNFAILRDTKCPAVLTENMFQDNRHDVDYLLSERGKSEIADLHVTAITQYLKSL
jgi:N-acetylmuramoyl-L-alanine amidase